MPEEYPFRAAVVATAVRPPAFDELYAEARLRRRRRQALIAGVFVIVVLAAIALPLAPRGGQVIPEVPPTADAPRVSRVLALSTSTVVAVSYRECDSALAVTTDGGRTWSDWQYTPPPATCTGPRSGPIEILPLDEHTFLLTREDEQPGGTFQRHQDLSVDGGRTWRPLAETARDVTALPATATVVDCGANQCFGHGNDIFAIDPSAGTVYRLTARPGGLAITGYTAAGGVLWAVLNSGQALAWSTDRGANWHVEPTPEMHGAEGVFAADADHAWLLYLTDDGKPPHIRYTTDGGRGWQDTATNLPAAVIDAVPLTGTADGALLSGGWVSRDGGATFTALPIPPGPDTPVFSAGRGVMVAQSGGKAYLTGDGDRWVTVPLP
ncbi:hypothetical protein Dvina_25375 [Dactylosporangium vinaceum]|uniref:Uncharacterized protein n=1 Tax=Dactylosporangium vinaceum TaxID=53362 RepID=A0ABV5MDQ6_9ACTN|nr:hypothetical protein [Dactylosporangium vinaceum]UAC01090.1 hypothetical protein Dvina_25375 [Dactylosporangium vinaceum]